MSIALKTHKMIWGRSGNMCAFPECKKILVIDETMTDDPSVIGEEAHIVAQKEDGPRGKSILTPEQRDKYENLILLCNIHHKIIDDQEIEYTVEKLHQYKNQHEKWVEENLIKDVKKIKEDELYATYIEKFIQLTDLHNWNNWTSWILGASQLFRKAQFNSLRTLPDYIISRIWPNRYIELEKSLINFKNITNDLFRVYYEYPNEKPRSDGYTIERFYKKYYRDNFIRDEDWSRKNELLALEKHDYHVRLIIDLVLELTRAANCVCDKVRDYLFEGFRLEEGVLLITHGDFFSSQTYRVEYRDDERVSLPYPGLKAFMEQRENRDLNFGVGFNEDYFKTMPWEE